MLEKIVLYQNAGIRSVLYLCVKKPTISITHAGVSNDIEHHRKKLEVRATQVLIGSLPDPVDP